jgi:O-antigen/teichoic acid export membrane protein
MSTAAVIGRNILSNWAGFASQIVITFLLTPYIVNSLGNTYYGIWALVISLTGYYGLLDLGFSAGLTQYVSRYYAKRDFERLNETVSTGFVVLAACAGALLVGTVVLALLANRVFEIPAHAAHDVQLAILIVGGGVAIQFLFFPYSAVFPATQRFDISNAIGIGTRLLFALSVWLALDQGYGLVGVSVASAASGLVDYLIRLLVSYRLVPTLRVRPRLANMARGWELAHFGIWNIVIAGSVRLISYTSAIIIALFLPAAAITPFALASNLSEYFMRIFVPIGQVFFPVFTEHDARGDEKAIRVLFLNGTRLLAVLALPAGLLAYWLSDEFFALWIGEAAKRGEFPSAAGLFSVLILASVVSAVQRVSYQVLLGTRRMRILAVCFIIEGVANLLLSVGLVRPFGLYGVAFGTILPALIIEGVVFPLLICRLYSIRFREYLLKVLGPAVLITLVLYPMLYAIGSISRPATWTGLVLDGGAAAVIVGVLIFNLGMSTEERQRFVWKPISSLRRRCRTGAN